MPSTVAPLSRSLHFLLYSTNARIRRKWEEKIAQAIPGTQSLSCRGFFTCSSAIVLGLWTKNLGFVEFDSASHLRPSTPGVPTPPLGVPSKRWLSRGNIFGETDSTRPRAWVVSD